MKKRLDVCFVGLGSIGRRHLKNLAAAAEARGLDLHVVALRHANSPLPEDVAGLVDDQCLSVDGLPHVDLAFICNPSQQHLGTLRELEGKADRFFVEKPVFTAPLPESELGCLADERRYYVACPLRHTRVFSALADFVSQNSVFAVRSICSSYLPEWRPGADYRKLYCATAESGGVKLDLVHDFDYLFSIFGIPEDFASREGKFSDLEVAGPDSVAFMARYDRTLVELHLDYFGRVPQRYSEVYTKDDTVRFDFIDASVSWLKSGKRLSFADARNDFQMREIEQFLDFALLGGENVNSIPFANKVISIAAGGMSAPRQRQV